MLTPSKFIPQAVADFVGHGDFGAATAARSIEALVAQSRANHNASMAFLFNGRPGIGKSALAHWFIYDVLGCSKFSITKYNGTRVNLERVEDLAAGLPYPSPSFVGSSVVRFVAERPLLVAVGFNPRSRAFCMATVAERRLNAQAQAGRSCRIE